jgi:hypothetical protein
MPLKQRRAAGVVLATVLALSSAQLRATTCKTTEGTFTSNLVQPPTCQSPTGLCTLGTLNGKFPETYDFLIDTFGPPDPSGQAAYTGHSVITRTRGGATLLGQDSGVMTFTGPTTATFVTTVNIVGGTKQFASATGQYVATGQLDFATGEASGTFTSTVCK